MRTLSKEEFVKYARQQIEVADQLVAAHRHGSGRWCSCGRQLPCSVATHATAMRERYQAKLALLDTTAVLPVFSPPAPVRTVSLWRRLLGGGR